MTRRLTPVTKAVTVILLLALVGLLQLEYDATKTTLPASAAQTISPFMVRLLDMGFHPAVASFLWATTMPEILDLWNKKTEYFTDLAFVNAVDPEAELSLRVFGAHAAGGAGGRRPAGARAGGDDRQGRDSERRHRLADPVLHGDERVPLRQERRGGGRILQRWPRRRRASPRTPSGSR